ncbi:hypothetical protein DMC30DRAFT_349286, partial [Rhodotorula diobovata]
HPLARVDLYACLGLAGPSSSSPPASVSQADIRQAYRALILQHHPDRAGRAGVPQDASEGDRPGADELNQAYEVLSDDDQRRTYDVARAAALAASRASAHAFAVSLSLDLFEPHYAAPAPASSTTPSRHTTSEEEEDDPAYYTHPCRCSSQFKVTREQLEEGVEVVTCEGCSERCRVEYEVVEE